MQVVRRVSEDEVVLAFLRAELDAPRWGGQVSALLGGNDDLVRQPDLGNVNQNAARRNVLAAYRGYGRNAYLFAGFPNDVEWWRVTVTVDELGGFRFARYPSFSELSGGTFLAADGAANLDKVVASEDLNARVKAIAGSAVDHPEIIALARDPASEHVILEGNTRAAAYVSRLAPNEIGVFAGYSSLVPSWVFY